MPFIDTIAEAGATGATAEMYARSRETHGYRPNMVMLFGERPDVMAGWNARLGAIRGHLDVRRYELVTLAAARALKSLYCMLAHGSVLMKIELSADDLRAIVTGAPEARLTPQEREIMAFAAKIATDASSVTQSDVARLRDMGLSEAEIFDIAAVAARRCFYSKLLVALGAEPDRAYAAIEPQLRAALTVGRPIAAADAVPHRPE